MRSSEPSDRSLHLARMALGSLALVLALAGQLWLYSSPDGLRPATLLSIVALVLFAGSLMKQPPAGVKALVVRLSLSPTAILVGTALLLDLIATLADIYWKQINYVNYVPILVLWLGCAVTYMVAFMGNVPQRNTWRSWWRTYRAELIGIGLLTLGAAMLRFYQLGTIPRVIDGDEGRMGQYALATSTNPLASPFTTVESIGSLYLQMIGAAVHMLGQNPLALRLLPAVGGTLAIPALYLLARYLFGPPVAFVAAALLTFSHAHIHFSRTVAVAYIPGTLLVPLELYFFLSGLEKQSAGRLAVGGLLLGFHFNIYLDAQIIAAIVIVYLLIAVWLCRPLVQRIGYRLGIFWLGAGLTALPMLVYAWRHPHEFFNRLNVDGTFQSGWLANTMATTGQNALRILADRFAHALLSLNYYPAVDFYNVPAPLLDVVTSALFVLGLGCALWRTRHPGYLLVNGYFWGITLAIGLFSAPPSADSYRMLAALPAAILLAAVGLSHVWAIWSLNEPERRAVRLSISTFVLTAVLALNLRTYFVDFAQRCRYGGDAQTRFASYLGNYLRTLDRQMTVYLLSDEIFRYGTHDSASFLSSNFPVTNVADPVTSLAPRPNTVIIASPNRMDELQAWARENPGGQLQQQSDCENRILLAYRFH